MSKNDIPPRITGWWLTETCRPQRAPSEEVSVSCRPRRSCRLRRRLSSLGLSLLASAPLLETPSAMGFALCLTALMSVALVSGKLMPRSLTGLPLAFSRFALVIPMRLAEDVGKYPRLGSNCHQTSEVYHRNVEEPRSYPVSMFENAASLGNWGCPIRRPTVGIANPNRQAYWLGLTRSLGVSR